MLLQDADIRLVVIGQSAHHHIEVIIILLYIFSHMHNVSLPHMFPLC